MGQYEKIQQLLKKEPGTKERVPIFTPTVIQAVFDGKTGAPLEAILAQFNSVFVQYQGTAKDTRILIPAEMRRPGLIITYVNAEGETVSERASLHGQADNEHWALDVNWSRIDELSLSGDIAVSARGTWIINGADTGIKAVGPKGENGITPWLKEIDNKLHYSYDNVKWTPCSDPLSAQFRNHNNRIQISYDKGKNWKDISDPVATYVRFAATSSTGQDGSIGKFQYSHDKTTWLDLSPEFRNYLRIQGYVATHGELPTGVPVGTIYGVGPFYEAGDTTNTNPMYQIRVWDGSQWVNNGTFNSIAAGIVQETGNSETEVMSQKAVTEELSKLGLVSFENESFNVSNCIIDLKFYSNYRDITLQRVGFENNKNIIFYEWDSEGGFTRIIFNEDEAVVEGNIYTWDFPDRYLRFDYTNSKSFGFTTRRNNQVLGKAFYPVSKYEIEEIKSDINKIYPISFKQNAYLYSITSPSSSKIPAIVDNILNVPAQTILPEALTHKTLEDTSIDLNSVLDNYNYGYLFYNIAENKLVVIKANAVEYPNDFYFVALLRKNEGFISINCRYWNNNGMIYSSIVSENRLKIIEDSINKGDSNLSDEDCSLIIGKDLFFIDGEKLPIYKSSISINNKVKKLCLIQKIQEWGRFNKVDFNFPKYHYFEDVLYFDSTNSTSKVSIVVVNGTEDVIKGVRNINIHHVSKDKIKNKSIKYLPFGASNTQFGFGRIVSQYLDSLECNVIPVGVLTQGGSYISKITGETIVGKGEGRGGWGYLTYIGRKPYNQGNWITYPDINTMDFDYKMNPFMRVCTNQDFIDNPEYCFPTYEYAGQGGVGEQYVPSYKELIDGGYDTSNFGTFYIFDFAWYLQNRHIDAPDIMTIQLGLNDNPAIEASKFALPYILNSVVSAVPNIRIGICPSPAVQQTISGDTYVTNYSSYNNWLNTFLQEYGNNIKVLNLAASMNRQYDFAFNLVNGTLISDDGNLTEKINVSDNDEWGGKLHSDNNGFMEIAKCIGAYIANQL